MSNELVVGKTSVQATSTTWPNQWTWPAQNHWIYPSTYIYTSHGAPREEEYANEVEVDQNEHDATLRFYRRRAKGARTLVKEVTVPIGVLEWLQGDRSGE